MEPAEVKKFEEFEKLWWDPNSIMVALHRMNQVRIPFLIENMKKVGALKDGDSKKPLKGLDILDAGCGCGFLSEALCRLGAKVTGVDVVSKTIEVAKAHAAADDEITDLTYFCGSIEDYTKQYNKQFDVVVMCEVLEHVTNKSEVVEGALKCLKPGGSFLVTTESKTYLSKFLTIYLFEYVLNLIPRGAHDMELYITPEDLQKLLEKHNCAVTDVRGTFYNFLTGNWRFVPFKTFYVMFAVKNNM